MRIRVTILLSAVAASVAGSGLLGWWLRQEPVVLLPLREPGQDGRPGTRNQVSPTNKQVRIGELFARGDGVPSSLPGSWPRFRGADFDNIVKDSVPLADAWPENGPPALWRVALGEGYAAPAVWNGRVFILDYDEEQKADMLRCLSLDDGRDIWRRGYRVDVKRNHGMSRTIPAVDGRRVVSIGPRCHVMCADAETGDFLWGLDLVRDFDARVPLWYTGQCPLIDEGSVVLAPGGRFLLVGVDLETGRIVWTTPNPEGWRMSHSSVIPVRIAGRRQYVYAAVEGVVGVAADGPDVGRTLWTCREWSHSVTVPIPVALSEGQFYLTTGYAAGGAVLQVREDEGDWAASIVLRFRTGEGLSSEQQTPILYDGCLFGVMPKDGGSLRSQFVCVLAEDPRRVLWSSGKTERFGLGPYLIADGKIFVLDDDGVLTLLRATRDGYERLARAKVLSGEDSWGPMALVAGRLLARDTRHMICLDVRKPESP